MQFLVIKQIAVEADTPEEAVAKASEGATVALSATLRKETPAPVRTPAVMQHGPQQSKTG